MHLGLLDDRLTTSPEAARAYRAGVAALVQRRRSALRHFASSLALDPTFALAHAALALLGHELGARVDVRTRVTTAQLHSGRTSAFEQSHVRAVALHIGGDEHAVARHLDTHPGDAVLASLAAAGRAARPVS